MAYYTLAAKLPPRLSSPFFPHRRSAGAAPNEAGLELPLDSHSWPGVAAQTDVGSRLWVDLNPWDTQGEAFTSALKAPSYPQTLILTSLWEGAH